MDTNLGGGNHGYLGLVLTRQEYLNLPNVNNTPFRAPHYPNTINIQASTDPVQAVSLREAYHEEIRKYRKCHGVEKALLAHIKDAVNAEYLDNFYDKDLARLTGNIPDILNHLFKHYGQVCSKEVKNLEKEVTSIK